MEIHYHEDSERPFTSQGNTMKTVQLYCCLNYCLILGAPGTFVPSFWYGEWPWQLFCLQLLNDFFREGT